MPFVLTTPVNPGTGGPPGNTASWTEFATPGPLQVVFSEDISPAAGAGEDNIFILPYVIVGGEILSVVLVTNDSGQTITPGTSLINYGIIDNGAGQKLVSVHYPNTGPGRAGDSLIAIRLYAPL